MRGAEGDAGQFWECEWGCPAVFDFVGLSAIVLGAEVQRRRDADTESLGN